MVILYDFSIKDQSRKMISVNSPLGTRQLLDLEVEVVLIFSSTEHRPSAGMKVS